jgi:CRP-like cAMP-binding protein
LQVFLGRAEQTRKRFDGQPAAGTSRQARRLASWKQQVRHSQRSINKGTHGSLRLRRALERTAYLLLHLFARAAESGLVRNGSIQFPFTQQHLADTLGMSLVHTNKTLKRLYLSNAVRWKDRVFEIVDRAALVRVAGNDIPQHRRRPFI